MFNYTQVDPEKIEFIEIAPVNELASGERMFVTIGDRSIVIFNIIGNLYAIADICSHDDGPLGDGDLDGHEITCPRHGARFDVRTGEALLLPAVVDIPAYPVRMKEGMIEIGVPKE